MAVLADALTAALLPTLAQVAALVALLALLLAGLLTILALLPLLAGLLTLLFLLLLTLITGAELLLQIAKAIVGQLLLLTQSVCQILHGLLAG